MKALAPLAAYLLLAALAVITAYLTSNSVFRHPSKPLRLGEGGGALRYSVYCTILPGALFVCAAVWSAYDAWRNETPGVLAVTALFAGFAWLAFDSRRKVRVSWDERGIEGLVAGFPPSRVLVPWSSIASAGILRSTNFLKREKAWVADTVWDANGFAISWQNCSGGAFLSDELRARRPDLFKA